MTGVPFRDRRKALLLLAGSRYDYTPGPSTWRKNPLHHRNEPGRPSPSKKELCKTCDGDRVVRDKFGREDACPDCSGRGWHRTDAYTGEQVSTFEAPAPARTRRVLCDRCAGDGVWKGSRCELCDGAGKVSVPLDVGPLEPDRDGDVALNEWERMMLLREREGSYRELDLALAELARRSPWHHRLFVRVHVLRNAGQLSPTEALGVERAVGQLLAWMPAVIRVPGEVVAGERRTSQAVTKGRNGPRGALAERDALIRERFRAGETAAGLAEAFDLSVRRVNEIVFAERAA